MKNAETQLREIQLALKYCELDYDAILEDYREHLRELNEAKQKQQALINSKLTTTNQSVEKLRIA